jgi:hypothetical protein
VSHKLHRDDVSVGIVRSRTQAMEFVYGDVSF